MTRAELIEVAARECVNAYDAGANSYDFTDREIDAMRALRAALAAPRDEDGLCGTPIHDPNGVLVGRCEYPATPHRTHAYTVIRALSAPAAPKAPERGACPKCGGRLHDLGWGLSCRNCGREPAAPKEEAP